MTKKFKSLLTDKGKALIADAIAGGKTINLKYLAVGDGNGSEITPSAAQTALVNEVARLELNSVKETDANRQIVTAEAIIPADRGGFWIREAGIFTSDGILIAVSQMPVTYKPDSDDGTASTQTIRMLLAVSEASVINLTVDDSMIIATEDFVNDAIKAHEKSRNHPDATTTEKGFVQLSSATNSTSEAQAATPKAVKAANDNANSRLEKEMNLSDLPDKVIARKNLGFEALGIGANVAMLDSLDWQQYDFTLGQNLVVKAGSMTNVPAEMVFEDETTSTVINVVGFDSNSFMDLVVFPGTSTDTKFRVYSVRLNATPKGSRKFNIRRMLDSESDATVNGAYTFTAPVTTSAGVTGNLIAVNLGGKTLSLNTLTLADGALHAVLYNCKSNGEGAGITGRPDDTAKNAFSLVAELIRHASDTDYITRQTYISGASQSSWMRHCIDGKWGGWVKVPMPDKTNTWTQKQSFSAGVDVTGNTTCSGIVQGKLITSDTVLHTKSSVSYLPPESGAHIGWNRSSGSGATDFINHKGAGPGGFDFWNGDEKTQTKLAGIDASGSLSLSGNMSSTNEVNTLKQYTGTINDGDYLNGGLLRSFLQGRGGNGDTRGAYAALYVQEHVGAENQAILNLNGFSQDHSWAFKNDGSFNSPGIIVEAGQRVYSPNNPPPLNIAGAITGIRLAGMVDVNKNNSDEYGTGCVMTGWYDTGSSHYHQILRVLQYQINYGDWVTAPYA